MSAIDWSDVENIEPVPGGDWDGWKVVGHYRSANKNFPHLVVFQGADGVCHATTTSDDGRLWINGPRVIRNKPKRVTLQECWVIYTPDGQYGATVFSEEAAEEAWKGYIFRHIPAEEREV